MYKKSNNKKTIKKNYPSSSLNGKKNNKKTIKKQKNSQKADIQLLSILLFAIGIFLTSLTIIEGTNIWLFLHNIMFGFFGLASYVFGPIMIYMSITATSYETISLLKSKVFQSFFLILFLSSSIQIFMMKDLTENNLIDNITFLFNSGVNNVGGGLLGGLFSGPLIFIFGMTGANIILILFIFVFIMLISGSTLIDFFKFIIAPFKLIGKAYKENISSDKYAEKEVEFPSHPVCSKRKFIDIPDDQISDNISKIKNNTDHFDIPLDDNILKETNHKDSEKILLSLDKEEKINKPKKISTETSLDQKNLIDNLVKKVALDMSLNSNKNNDNIVKKSSLKQQKEEEIQSMKDELEAANVKYIIEEEYKIPPSTFLKKFIPSDNEDISQELKGNAERLVDTLKSFGVQTRVIDISRGPAVTRYELQPSAGVKISKITNLSDDIALNLATAGVRIEAPIPNKAAVGIEVPNKNVDIVTLREIIESDDFKNSKSKLTVALGKDITGNMAIADLSRMPHTLIAGSTGSGKSVCINSIIVSILYKSSPEEVKIVMIDPKVVELGIYNGIPHLLVPVVTDPRKAAGALNWAVTEMLNRYKIFADSGVRDLAGYNKFANKKDDIKPMPQIVIIIDELADLMMAAPNEVEDAICRLAQMARAAGMHLVIATQRPSVDVITGVIKANIPSRIAFAVSSQVDSRTILDGSGAEKLLGRGDMLFAPMGSSKPIRVQGCFVSDTEVEQVVSFIKNKKNHEYDEEIIQEIEKQSVVANQKEKNSGDSLEDEMLMPAIRCIVESGQASTSYLQRKLKLGYARAARIIDDLEDRGIIGPYEGGKRKVIMSKQDFLEMNINIDNS